MKKKFWLILYHLGGSVVLFIVTVHVSSRLDNGDLMFSDTGIGSKYYRGKI